MIDVIQDSGPSDLPEEVKVQDSILNFDRGERSLVQILHAADNAIIVTNDEDAFDVINELAMTNVIEQLPIMSVSLVECMYRCQALTAEQAGTICDQAVASMIPGISMRKRNRKERHAQEVVQRIAIAEEKRLLSARVTRDASVEVRIEI